MALVTKRYKSAPITEAVIELRVQPTASSDISVLERLAASFTAEFPKQAPMQFLQMGIEAKVGEPVQQSVSRSNIGFRLTKADDSRVLQFRHDGFAYSHMAPYSDWDTFKTEARLIWAQYRAACPNAPLTRCALRYINRFDIPSLKVEPEEYFLLYPHIPETLTQQDVVGMTLNLQMPQLDLECIANVGEALVAPVKPNHLSFVLDIDIFRLGIETWDDKDAWNFVDKLRQRKNEIFEGCITDKTRKLIDQ